jgi:hypothetical protein
MKKFNTKLVGFGILFAASLVGLILSIILRTVPVYKEQSKQMDIWNNIESGLSDQGKKDFLAAREKAKDLDSYDIFKTQEKDMYNALVKNYSQTTVDNHMNAFYEGGRLEIPKVGWVFFNGVAALLTFVFYLQTTSAYSKGFYINADE